MDVFLCRRISIQGFVTWQCGVQEHRLKAHVGVRASGRRSRGITSVTNPRRYAQQADSDDGTREQLASVRLAGTKRLRTESTRFRVDVVIWWAAASFLVGKLVAATVGDGFHRHDEIRKARELVGLSGSLRAGSPDRRAHPSRPDRRCRGGSNSHRGPNPGRDQRYPPHERRGNRTHETTQVGNDADSFLRGPLCDGRRPRWSVAPQSPVRSNTEPQPIGAARNLEASARHQTSDWVESRLPRAFCSSGIDWDPKI